MDIREKGFQPSSIAEDNQNMTTEDYKKLLVENNELKRIKRDNR